MNNISDRNLFLSNSSGKSENFSSITSWLIINLIHVDNSLVSLNHFLSETKQNFFNNINLKCNIRGFYFNFVCSNQKNFQSDFVFQLLMYVSYLPNFVGLKIRITQLLLEISTKESTFSPILIRSNFNLRKDLFLVFLKIRLLNILSYILLNFFEKNIKFWRKFKISPETKEINTMFSEKRVLILKKILSKMNMNNIRNKMLRNYVKMRPVNKFAKHIFFIQLKKIRIFNYQKLITISIINRVLKKKLSYHKFSFYFFRKNISNRFKTNGKLKNVIKFIKKEIFYCSIYIFSKNFKTNNQLKFFREVRSLFLKIYKNSVDSIYKFNVLQKFSFFFEKFKNNSSKKGLLEKNFNNSEKSLLIDFLIKFDPPKQKEKEAMISKKIILKKALTYLTKGLILSNSLKKFVGFLWYLTTFSLLKKALENSWRIQLTNRNTIFYELNLNSSIKFSSEIIKFFTKIQIKFRSHLLDELLINFQKRSKMICTSFNLFILVENLFKNSQMTLKTKFTVFTRQLNRIIGIGNFFLLTILRVKKIFTNNFKIKSEAFQRKNNLLYIFQKKIEILTKNLNNSINFLEVSKFF